MHVVLVRFSVKPDSIEAFRSLVLAHAKNSLGEEGCRQFDVSTDPDKPGEFLLYERYDDLAAFEIHKQTEYFAKFGEATESMLENLELSCWQTVSG